MCVSYYFFRKKNYKEMAPHVGFEPTTLWLTARCSTAELMKNKTCGYYNFYYNNLLFLLFTNVFVINKTTNKLIIIIYGKNKKNKRKNKKNEKYL